MTEVAVLEITNLQKILKFHYSTFQCFQSYQFYF